MKSQINYITWFLDIHSPLVDVMEPRYQNKRDNY